MTGRPFPRNAGDSTEDFELVSKWLADCWNNHRRCPKASSETPLPTRVIAVGSPDGCAEPFLLESCGKTGLYITLSHCWGGEVPLTTTTTTLEARKSSIPFLLLPKTFQDAIIITRKLGIRYLWIDSLCILQDSGADWERESAMMGQVYSSGFLNIAARGAVNAKSGCFISREPEPPACDLRYEAPDESVIGCMYIRDPSYRSERLRDTPLDKRGWVLQERLLSPRIVYFGRQQMYWECVEATIRQDGKHHDVTNDDLRDFKQSLDFDAVGPRPSIGKQIKLDELSQRKQLVAGRFLQWYNVVAEYTRRGLTFQSDKLPAIAGLARTFHTKFDATYVAGLWKEDLIAGLVWYLETPSEEIISENLPSWSWARRKCVVRFWSQSIALPLRTLDDACTLVSVECTLLAPLNPYGDVKAKVFVRGRILSVVYRPRPDSIGHEYDYTVVSMKGISVGNVMFDSNRDKPENFFGFLVHGGDNYAAGLALESDNKYAERFRRIGYVSIRSWKNIADGRTPFREVEPRTICLI